MWASCSGGLNWRGGREQLHCSFFPTLASLLSTSTHFCNIWASAKRLGHIISLREPPAMDTACHTYDEILVMK